MGRRVNRSRPGVIHGSLNRKFDLGRSLSGLRNVGRGSGDPALRHNSLNAPVRAQPSAEPGATRRRTLGGNLIVTRTKHGMAIVASAYATGARKQSEHDDDSAHANSPR